MKFFKVILFILLFISPSNANTIYNLIKIPNLEIYKNKSSNNVKYLKAVKPFQVGIRNDNVTCFNSQDKTINENFNLIEKNLNSYTSYFLEKINLKYIVLCENLTVSEISSAGVPNHKMRTLIIDLKFNKNYFERIIHHEIFHLIYDTHRNLFKDDEWRKINKKNFKYASCSTCSDKLNLSLLNNTEGFLTEYSMTTPSEDMAEVFSFLIAKKKIIKNKALNDLILNKKISYIKKNILEIDKNFKF